MSERVEDLIVKVVVRHGESVANALTKQADRRTNRVGGYQPEIELAPIGIEQARSFGRVAFSELGDILERPFR